MYGIFRLSFSSSSADFDGAIVSNHSSNSFAAIPPTSSDAIASAFRLADRRSFAFRLLSPSFSSSTSVSRSLRADLSLVLSTSERLSNAFDAGCCRFRLPFFFSFGCFLYHSISSAASAHPDSSVAIASALRFAARRSLAFISPDSSAAMAPSSFRAASDLFVRASSSSSPPPSLFSASSSGRTTDGSGGVYVSPRAAARAIFRLILAADLTMVPGGVQCLC
mmetsp:Transcript_15239/g.36569  ORF Transcript_15239/g.36569 Transcript_15239/m.36569 type:complete len:222 (-) Transcript_15239:39-704(-)